MHGERRGGPSRSCCSSKEGTGAGALLLLLNKEGTGVGALLLLLSKEGVGDGALLLLLSKEGIGDGALLLLLSKEGIGDGALLLLLKSLCSCKLGCRVECFPDEGTEKHMFPSIGITLMVRAAHIYSNCLGSIKYMQVQICLLFVLRVGLFPRVGRTLMQWQ